MSHNSVHNPDRYISDLRQIISQGKKRIGLLVGAGAPVSLRVDSEGRLCSEGTSIIPDVAGLTRIVLDGLSESDRPVVDHLMADMDDNPNIETILTRIRRLSQAIGSSKIYGLDGEGYDQLAGRICEHIGTVVTPSLPAQPNPYSELVSWVGGTNRNYPVEVFSPNYDLLMEEAFERAQLPYFDGFTGAHKPFFDPTSISNDNLPPRWSRLWKVHGSLGWDVDEGRVIRTGSRRANKLIFPDHLKYDQITRQPFSALFERLREFLTTPDSILICTGFSFFDAHIVSVLDEALEENAHTAVFAFQYKSLEEESYATDLAVRRPNVSVYARDGAVISGVKGDWKIGKPLSQEWGKIRDTFWSYDDESKGYFTLGDFSVLARFFALSKTSEFTSSTINENLEPVVEEGPAVADVNEDLEGSI